ncbi:MAG: TetR/AcrR family transcriptional regulator [Herpetosiphonaceae bacterium]|nr:TetR/AcrR family transcriptional regulator [Herpetosiphonaceae bacterium]
MAATPKQLSARERILETASQLFYRHGFQAVGIDTIIAEAGVAKMTLYRHFAAKDDLIVAYLERSNQHFWSWLEGEIAGIDDPEARLLAIFDAVGRLVRSPQCLGCTFQATAVEFPNLEYRAHQVALAHKQALISTFRDLAERANLRAPAVLANQLLLLMDGAWVAARMFGPTNPATEVAAAAQALIAAQR